MFLSCHEYFTCQLLAIKKIKLGISRIQKIYKMYFTCQLFAINKIKLRMSIIQWIFIYIYGKWDSLKSRTFFSNGIIIDIDLFECAYANVMHSLLNPRILSCMIEESI